MSGLLSNLFTRYLGGIAALLMLVSVNVHADEDELPQWLFYTNGAFTSQIYNGSGMVTGETIFTFKGKIPFGGRYRFDNGDRTQTVGVLSGCRPTGAFALHCAWSDQFGSGALNVLFTQNMLSFRGMWGSSGHRPQYSWNGVRKH